MSRSQNMQIKIFEKVWKNRLIDSFTGKPCKVIKVKGWKTALIETPCGARMTTTFCIFPWE